MKRWRTRHRKRARRISRKRYLFRVGFYLAISRVLPKLITEVATNTPLPQSRFLQEIRRAMAKQVERDPEHYQLLS